MKPRIYDRDMQLVGILQNASAISYTRAHNDLYTASFELPWDDPKTSLCDTHYIVDIFDGDESKGKYRILNEPETDVTSDGQFAKYSCEHVIAFLLNDVIDGYLEVGGTGKNTRTVIEGLLAKQTVQRWRLGTCDFNYQFQYSWENTNLLDALFSIPSCFSDNYHWTYDTNTYPWTINLVSQNEDRSCEIRRKRNMQYIKREKDASSGFYTRLYCKGSGEGVNQLGIKDVNSGKAYIDADTISTYGVICGHYIDLTLTDAQTLLAKGRAVLKEVKHPRYTYKAKAVDLSKVTGLDWHKFDEGKYVRVIDEEKKIDLDAMIVEVSKNDVDGDPLNVEITISNKPSDVSSAIEDLSKRAAITAQYSQGATNMYAEHYADNASDTKPLVCKFYVDEGCVQINAVLLEFSLENFRSYSSTSESGGGSSQTSTSGGGGTHTSEDGGSCTLNEPQRIRQQTLETTTEEPRTNAGEKLYTDSASGSGSHNHQMYHFHKIRSTMNITIPALQFNIGAHSHNVSVPNHSHTVSIPNHSHNIEHGIYEGGSASSVTIKVDGNSVPASAISGGSVDLVAYLAKNSNGKITRNTWHRIEITPNSLTRIVADVFVKTFIRSIGGGNY